MRSASLRLGISWQLDGGGVREECGGVLVGVDAHAVAGHVVHHDRVGALAQQFGAAVLHAIFCLGGKANDHLAGPAAAHHFGKNVFGGRELERKWAGALQLLLGNVDGPVVGDGSGLDDQGGLAHARKNGVAHLVGRGHLDQLRNARADASAVGPLTRMTLAPRLCAASASA